MNQKIGVPVVGVISHPGHETEFALLTMRRRRRTHTAVNVHTHIIRGQGRSMSVFLEVNAPISLNNGAARTTTTVVQGSSQSHCTIFILWNGIVFQGRTLDFFSIYLCQIVATYIWDNFLCIYCGRISSLDRKTPFESESNARGWMAPTKLGVGDHNGIKGEILWRKSTRW